MLCSNSSLEDELSLKRAPLDFIFDKFSLGRKLPVRLCEQTAIWERQSNHRIGLPPDDWGACKNASHNTSFLVT